MKSCKNCKKFNNTTDKCYKFEVGIIDKTNAQYCKFYEEKRDIKEKIKCIIKISSNITDKVRNFCCGLFPFYI